MTTLEKPLEMLDWESFAPKFHESWHKKIKPAIESKWMWDIYQTLKKDGQKERIVPDSSNTFRAFLTTDMTKLKCIWVLMDPYPRLYKDGKTPQATGIAMDCSNSPDGTLQPSLELFYDEMQTYVKRKVTRHKSLDYLHEQGVMFLNSDLTCKVNKTQSHEGLWEPFMKYLFEEVLGQDTHLVYVLAGKASQKLEKYINPFCTIFKVEHPAAAAHKHTSWNSDGVFRKINDIMKDNKVDQIFWDYEEWQDVKELPF